MTTIACIYTQDFSEDVEPFVHGFHILSPTVPRDAKITHITPTKYPSLAEAEEREAWRPGWTLTFTWQEERP